MCLSIHLGLLGCLISVLIFGTQNLYLMCFVKFTRVSQFFEVAVHENIFTFWLPIVARVWKHDERFCVAFRSGDLANLQLPRRRLISVGPLGDSLGKRVVCEQGPF